MLDLRDDPAPPVADSAVLNRIAARRTELRRRRQRSRALLALGVAAFTAVLAAGAQLQAEPTEVAVVAGASCASGNPPFPCASSVSSTPADGTTSVTRPRFKPGQVTDHLPTRETVLAAVRKAHEGGVLRKIDRLDAKLSTVADLRRLRPSLDLPMAWPDEREVWVVLAEGDIIGFTSDKVYSWMIQVIGGPQDDPIYASRFGGTDDPERIWFDEIPSRSTG